MACMTMSCRLAGLLGRLESAGVGVDVLEGALYLAGDEHAYKSGTPHRLKNRRLFMPRSYFSARTTASPIASELVNPGDSIPNKFTRPLTPCTAGP